MSTIILQQNYAQKTPEKLLYCKGLSAFYASKLGKMFPDFSWPEILQAGQPFLFLGVSCAHNGDRVEPLPYEGKLLPCQDNVPGPCVFLKAGHCLCSGNGDNGLSLRKDPGERNARRRSPLPSLEAKKP